jgi:septin family protein
LAQRAVKSSTKGPSGKLTADEVETLSAFEAIDRIAYQSARAPLDTEQSQFLFLRSWWAKTYNRPLKDPLLQTYTLEELYYEYRDRVEREEYAQEATEEAADNIEQKKLDEAAAWAAAEEEKELAEAAKQEISDDDKAWMEEQIRQAKAAYGEDFGENLEVDFSG